ncbi:hypothetical protein [Halorhodospira halochloris]|uniref:hypothetical protein n=1 Tax=Halorhodospira halochloris TaxID=1052 RepID=UPI001EE94B6E|nr:hypothetical protein [Halorhodospira halochloris]MCG5547514.1 hypothetical protein [Halorhodospira halochloris]
MVRIERLVHELHNKSHAAQNVDNQQGGGQPRKPGYRSDYNGQIEYGNPGQEARIDPRCTCPHAVDDKMRILFHGIVYISRNTVPLTVGKLIARRMEAAFLPPFAYTLEKTKDKIQQWWEAAYQQDEALPVRFRREAAASLPGIDESDKANLEDIYSAVSLRRMRLKHDQQIPEWLP